MQKRKQLQLARLGENKRPKLKPPILMEGLGRT